MNIYWLMVAAIIILGIILPQEGRHRKLYVFIMATLHIFVCGFRYMYLTGDLRKYAANYYWDVTEFGWFSPEILHEGKNTGFTWLMKFFSQLTNCDFQIFLIALAIITGVITAVFIYRYSPRPWLSFLVYNCMTFYITYGFSAIKQGLAMAILLCAMMCIFEKKPKGFLIFTLLAGFIHMPALVFLPAYWVANRRVTGKLIIGYIIFAFVVYLFRVQIVDLVSQIYYEDETFELLSTDLGGRVIVIVMILLCGLGLKGFREKQFEQLFNIIVVAAVLQMFSGFDNVFTRLADYYMQFSILFIPMIFYSTTDREVPINHDASEPFISFDEKGKKLLIVVITLVLIWWYYRTCLGVEIANEVDNYLNFRFMWDVLE